MDRTAGLQHSTPCHTTPAAHSNSFAERLHPRPRLGYPQFTSNFKVHSHWSADDRWDHNKLKGSPLPCRHVLKTSHLETPAYQGGCRRWRGHGRRSSRTDWDRLRCCRRDPGTRPSDRGLSSEGGGWPPSLCSSACSSTRHRRLLHHHLLVCGPLLTASGP